MNARVGVFVCHCGTNIGGVINTKDLVDYAKTLDYVMLADDGKWICSIDYLSKMKKCIDEHNLDRVVVVCCTPRTHEDIFRTVLREANLNPNLLEFVSIREQCSWVHPNPKIATEKAKDLVEMGVAKVIYLKPVEKICIPVGVECLVVGGGLAGMTAALAVAELGFRVILIEKNIELGGLLKNLNIVTPKDESADSIINEKKKRVVHHKNIEVHTNTQIVEIKGYIGNFEVTFIKNDEVQQIKVSTIIVSTGMIEVEPIGLYGYGEYENVITQYQFERMLKTGKLSAKDIVIINCANSMTDEYGCCNIGCLISVKNAKYVKKLDKDINVYILYRELNLKGADVKYLDDVVNDCCIMIRYSDDKRPIVSKVGGTNKLIVSTYDTYLNDEVKINADLVVLTPALKGDDTVEKLKGILKVSVDNRKFFQEAHVKLRPLEFATDGIYLCGCARSPRCIEETIEDALGSAMRATIPMRRGYKESSGISATIDKDLCTSCGICVDTCNFGAIEIVDDEPQVIKPICKGCGTCIVECPNDAMTISNYTNSQIFAQINTVLSKNPQQKILVFCCYWCALGAVDLAGISRFEYPHNIRIITVMCTGRIDPRFVYRAFELNVAGVLIAGCEFPTCHYTKGNYVCKKRVESMKHELNKKGINPDKLQTIWLSASDAVKFVSAVNDMSRTLLNI